MKTAHELVYWLLDTGMDLTADDCAKLTAAIEARDVEWVLNGAEWEAKLNATRRERNAALAALSVARTALVVTKDRLKRNATDPDKDQYCDGCTTAVHVADHLAYTIETALTRISELVPS